MHFLCPVLLFDLSWVRVGGADLTVDCLPVHVKAGLAAVHLGLAGVAPVHLLMQLGAPGTVETLVGLQGAGYQHYQLHLSLPLLGDHPFPALLLSTVELKEESLADGHWPPLPSRSGRVVAESGFHSDGNLAGGALLVKAAQDKLQEIFVDRKALVKQGHSLLPFILHTDRCFDSGQHLCHLWISCSSFKIFKVLLHLVLQVHCIVLLASKTSFNKSVVQN